MKIPVNIILSSKLSEEGNLLDKYSPLKVLDYSDFSTNNITINNESNLDIEIQKNYDDSVNIIWTDGNNDPRIVNSGFAKIEENKYTIPNSNLYNLYQKENVNKETKLISTSVKPSVFSLIEVNNQGNLAGGNYTFYLQYADDVGNKTDYISESGIISIFNGDSIKSAQGTLQDEVTNKAINIRISDIDTSYKKIYLSYIRDTSDTNGVILTKAYELTEPYSIDNTEIYNGKISVNITITGNEEVNEISLEKIETRYNIYNSAATIAQSQNMLFLGNVKEYNYYDKDLVDWSRNIKNISCKYITKSIDYIETQTLNDNSSKFKGISYYHNYKSSNGENFAEYYDPDNIYNYLGYWPNEYYRFGIVYIYNNGFKSSVYDISGYDLTDQYPVTEPDSINSSGIFKFPNINVFKGNFSSEKAAEVSPIGIKFKIENKEYLINKGIVNILLVRQKRIPISLAQGITIPTSKYGFMPLLYDSGGGKYKIQGDTFSNKLNKNNFNSVNFSLIPGSDNLYEEKGTDLEKIVINENNIFNCTRFNALLCLDAAVSSQLQSLFTGNSFQLSVDNYFGVLSNWNSGEINNDNNWFYRFLNYYQYDNFSGQKNYIVPNIQKYDRKYNLIYIPEDTPLKYINNVGFSTRAGSAEDAKTYSCIFRNDSTTFEGRNMNLYIPSPTRGTFMPFIGVYSSSNDDIFTITSSQQLYNNIYPSLLVTIKRVYSDVSAIIQERKIDNSPYYSASDIINISDQTTNNIIEQEIFRGDCFVCTVSVRYNNNFADPSFPVNDIVVGKKYPDWDTDISTYEEWNNVDRGSLNALKAGRWITYKCLSNYNLNLRSENKSNTEEISKFGQTRSFYPLRDASQKACYKVPESFILNAGYSATLPHTKYFRFDDTVPSVRTNFQNRIAYSNVHIFNSYTNGYKIFEGLSYKDVTNQYGAIVKLEAIGNNLFCVFEHGCAIVPINEKALLSTQEGESIHIYGSNVIPDTISIVSPDYGSLFKDSILRTANGIYGVDTASKKIWRYNESSGFVILSDMKLQSYLNDNLNFKNIVPSIGVNNVVTQYNNFKNDVLFTFYINNGNTYNVCFNEKLELFVTKYTWTPLLSTNVDNIFYSFNKNTFDVLTTIWKQKNDTDYYLSSDIDGNNICYWWFYPDRDLLTLYPKGKNILNWKLVSIETTDKTITGSELNQYVTINDNNIILSKNLDYFYFKLNFLFNDTDNKSFYIIKDYETLSDINKQRYAESFDSYLYRHNRNDGTLPPTKWYNKQEPFEFEFVVANPTGIHKIFDNLAIISNNVEPQSLEFEIIGDVYNFTKENIFKNYSLDEDNKLEVNADFPKLIVTEDQKSYSTKVVWDHRLNQYSLLTHQDCLNINEYGRRIGNIQYLEDKWNIVIQPIYYSDADKNLNSVRIRDKYIKIRVKYSGDKYVIITALSTLMRLSYA